MSLRRPIQRKFFIMLDIQIKLFGLWSRSAGLVDLGIIGVLLCGSRLKIGIGEFLIALFSQAKDFCYFLFRS